MMVCLYVAKLILKYFLIFFYPSINSFVSLFINSLRERGAFRLHTDTQLEDYFRVQNHQLNQQGEGCYRTREDQDRQRKGVWKMKVKGVPALDFPKQDQVYAPELGHEIYI